MAFLNQADRQRVHDAIVAAEGKTSGEFVAVLAGRSADYLFFPMLWAAVASLIVPGAILLSGADFSLLLVYVIQLAVFITAGLVCFRASVRPRLVPRAFRHEYGHRFAREQFFARGVHNTVEHSGVLLFVSSAERYVEIVADEGIHQKIGEEAWQAIVDTFVANVKAGQVAEGFATAASAIGDAMAHHYPRAADDVDRLPNGLIEI